MSFRYESGVASQDVTQCNLLPPEKNRFTCIFEILKCKNRILRAWVIFKSLAFKNVISLGTGEPLVTEYRSCVYRHSLNPEWQETVKVR